VDLTAHVDAAFHNLLTVAIRVRHLGIQGARLLGTGRLSLTKCVDAAEMPVRRSTILTELWHRFDPDRMLLLPIASIPGLHVVRRCTPGKLVLDATGGAVTQAPPSVQSSGWPASPATRGRRLAGGAGASDRAIARACSSGRTRPSFLAPSVCVVQRQEHHLGILVRSRARCC
jgi:hypothetical protein